MKNGTVIKKILSVLSIVILVLQSFNINIDAKIINDIVIALSSVLALFGIISAPTISKQLTDIFGISFKDFNIEEFIKKFLKKDADSVVEENPEYNHFIKEKEKCVNQLSVENSDSEQIKPEGKTEMKQ